MKNFLYRRNEIQANSIDSIIKSGSILFVGVGAAHLPGDRGVIEMLRAKGYKLRPVKMGERASKTKDLVDKTTGTGCISKPLSRKMDFIKVDIPGKFYKSGEDGALGSAAVCRYGQWQLLYGNPCDDQCLAVEQ